LSRQAEGVAGKVVAGMICRSVRARFRNVYWAPPAYEVRPPAVFVCNHHGWFDGYVMFLALTKLGVPFLDWIAEFEAFPLFAKVGGMSFPPDRPEVRAATIRQTIRRMKQERRSLLLFAEGTLHEGPEILPLGKALDLIAAKVPEAQIIPVAIRYPFSLHERPEAILRFGDPLAPGADLRDRAGAELARMLADRSPVEEVLFAGTLDVNERLDMRRFRGGDDKRRKNA
jgi:1-acyl-sn-glycerol-3-phosphate acyltransferase